METFNSTWAQTTPQKTQLFSTASINFVEQSFNKIHMTPTPRRSSIFLNILHTKETGGEFIDQ